MKEQHAGSIAHVPGLDGLRGVAVAGVLLFHSNALLRGGYLGVDLFFVLSGFLITSILVAEHERSGRVDLQAFWVRRARRLLPALLSLMPAVALYAKTLAARGELASLRADALATLAYVANWRSIVSHKSYWEMFAAPSPLEHTWSLAIEEQFYVLWPLVVVVVLRRRSPRALLAVSLALSALSMIAMTVLFDEASTMRAYLGTDTRGAAILLGAALATSRFARRTDEPAPRWLGPLALAASAVLAGAWVWLDGKSELLYRGGFWVTELAALVVLLACVRAPRSLVARALSVRPLRELGTISYGVYLWHWPVYVVLSEERAHLGGALLLALRLGVTLAIALVSHRFLEAPIRRHGLRYGRPLVVVPAAIGSVLAFVLLSTRVVGAAPSPAPPPPPPPPPPEVGMPDPTKVPFGFLPPASELPRGTLRVLVLGDSVALALGARMHFAQGSARTWTDHRAIGDCSILDGIAPVFSMSGPPHGNGNCARDWVSDVKELRPDVALVVLGGAYFSTVKVDGKRRGVCHPGWGAAYGKRLVELLDEMRPFTGRRAVSLAAYPVGKWRRPGLDDDVDCYNRILTDAAEKSGAEVVDLNAYACPEKKCTLTSRGAPVRPDGLHFDGLGAEDTAQWVLAELRRRASDAATDAGD